MKKLIQERRGSALCLTAVGLTGAEYKREFITPVDFATLNMLDSMRAGLAALETSVTYGAEDGTSFRLAKYADEYASRIEAVLERARAKVLNDAVQREAKLAAAGIRAELLYKDWLEYNIRQRYGEEDVPMLMEFAQANIGLMSFDGSVPPAPRNGLAWTPSDDADFRALVEQFAHSAAMRLGRSVSGIKARMRVISC